MRKEANIFCRLAVLTLTFAFSCLLFVSPVAAKNLTIKLGSYDPVLVLDHEKCNGEFASTNVKCQAFKAIIEQMFGGRIKVNVYPNGQSMLLTDGIINAIRRNGFDTDAAPLNSSQPVNVTIDLWSTAYQFGVGHKIRVAISSSNYPRFAINPNTGTPPKLYSYQYLDQHIANNTILIGPGYPSHIILPRPTSG